MTTHRQEIERRAAEACVRAVDLCAQAFREQGRGTSLRQTSAAKRAASLRDLTRLAALRGTVAERRAPNGGG